MFLNKVENIILTVKTFNNLRISTAYSCTGTQCPRHNKDLHTWLFQIFVSEMPVDVHKLLILTLYRKNITFKLGVDLTPQEFSVAQW